MGSIITAVRKLVVGGIATTAEFVTPDSITGQVPDVRFGWKANWSTREKVFTSGATFNHQAAGMRATKTHRNEEASFDLVILISGLGQTEEQASERALCLGGAVEDWCATHANWDGKVPGLNWLQVQGEGRMAAAFNDKGVLVELTYPIAYRARLT